MADIDLLDELGPGHDAEECEDRPCDWHLAMMMAADVTRLTAELAAANAALTSVSDLLDQARTERDALAGDVIRANADVQRLTAEVADIWAALTEVTELLDEARTQRDEARTELDEARANLAEEIAVAIENQDDQGIAEFDLLYQDCARIARQTAPPASSCCQAATSWTAVKAVLAGREAAGCTYIRVADVRKAFQGDPAVTTWTAAVAEWEAKP